MSNWDLISFLISSTLRFKIMIELNKEEKIPSKLSKILKVPISHVSKTLSDLEEKDLVKCLTPSRRKGKFYSITPLGEKILSEINELTL